MNLNKTVSVIGLGYIGLPTAAIFAARGLKVIGVDTNIDAVATINSGNIHIVEPDLDMVVHAAVKENYLRATLTPEPADVFLIAVPTPFKGNHVPDLSYIEAAAKSIAPVLKKGDLVILESTSPVGTTEKLAEWLAEECPHLSFPQQNGENSDIRLAHCPERVLPGRIMRELIENDRVIGGMTKKCSEAATAIYKIFVEGDCISTDVRTAEMCKLTENSFRDLNIAFANELSLICHQLQIDVWELIRLANLHPRVSILQPGPGVGGHCIAVDPWFIVDSAPVNSQLIRTAREVNDAKPTWVLERISEAISRILQNKNKTAEKEINIALLGLSFKPDIDDLRESPALAIAKSLAEKSFVQLIIVEPNIESLPASLGNALHYSFEEAIQKSDIVVILVAHSEFVKIRNYEIETKEIIDCVGLLAK